jgi:hypothetical protein
MSRMFRFALIGLAVAGGASMANAQVCAGTPSFSAGSARVGGNVLIGQNAKAYGASLALGEHRGWFVTGHWNYTKDDHTVGSANAGGGAIAYDWALNPEKTVAICPMVGVNVQEGSVVGLTPMANSPQNTLEFNFGGALGWVAAKSGTMEVIPSVGAALVARSYKAKIVQQGQPVPTNNDSFGLLSATIGFVFNSRCTISPLVQIPVSENNGKAAYGVAVSYNFNLPKALHM